MDSFLKLSELQVSAYFDSYTLFKISLSFLKIAFITINNRDPECNSWILKKIFMGGFMGKTLKFIALLVATAGVTLNASSAASTLRGHDPGEEQRHYSPKPFLNDDFKYVPMDILSNEVSWEVSSDLSEVRASAVVKFRVFDSGFPFLILNPNSRALLGGKAVELVKMTGPEFSESSYFALMKKSEPEKSYILKLEYTFNYDKKTMTNFLPLQYYYHKFVEQGVPANALFDRFPLVLNLKIKGRKNYNVFANGDVSRQGRQQFQIDFPKTFNSMAFFIDIVPKKEIIAFEKNLTSVDGRTIKALTYATTDEPSANKWVQTFAGILEYKFHELERLFGAFPQETLILKISDKGTGGGAYAGAMVLSNDYMEDMSHEIGHSWFLHSVTPARGEDAWIYEGFGNWAHLYRTGFAKDKNLEDSIVLGKGEYKVWTTSEMFPKENLRNPHQTGSMILASIDQTLKSSGKEELKGGLIPILKLIAQNRKHRTMSTKDFKALVEEYSGLDLTELFDYYLKN